MKTLLLAWALSASSTVPTATNSEFPGLRVPLRQRMGETRLLDWQEAPAPAKNMGVLVYEAGATGTSTLYLEERAVVIDRTRKRVVGDFLWKMKPLNGAPAVKQPEWHWGEHSVQVDFPETGATDQANW